MRNTITGKSNKMPENLQVRQLSKVAICVASMFYGSMATANPSGENVVSGTASFDQQGSQLNINNSNGAIINWNEFSIAQNEAVKFIQDSASSAVLNRVVGQLPSNILGELSSNGKVFLINPNGLLIGGGARIDTAGFVASTLNIDDQDFIAGNMKFKGNGGRINNQGYISAGKNGEVILIAPQIENSGIIEAEDGNILLAAGREVTLQSLDNPGIAFRVSAAGDKVLNLGQLLAENGSVKVFADQVMQQGAISANRLKQNADGSIVLEADTTIDVSGTVNAKGNNVDGGDIHILGDEVQVSNASIDASGESGGEVLVGGDYQGNGTVKNAQNTNIDANTVINADAGSNGKGGRVIVWSDDTTNTFAKITARGGSQSGDGGFVETSGKKALDFGQPADVSAANGAAGTWLLDPEDILIDEAKADSISSSLDGGSNVEVKTSDEGDGEGNITVAAAITKTEGDAAVSLTLDAHNRVDVNAPITSTAGPLNVNIKTGRQVANAEIEEPIETPEIPSETPDEMVDTDESQLVEEESNETDLDLMAEDTDEAIDNQLAEEAQQTSDEALTQVEQVTPEIEDTEIQAFIEEETQQIVITEDIDTAGGSISIQAGEEGDALISSEITTSQQPDSENQQAGDITIEAKRIALTDDAKVDASGEDAGDILIGGDRQGRNDEVQNAEFVYVSENAKVKADGGENGDGGKVIVFAEDTAIVEGAITAKGGTESGNGGFIETSGLKGLRVTKAPDASATNGESGEWLIDPFNILIGVSADFNITGATPFQATGTGAYLGISTLQAALVTNNVTIETTAAGGETGNITLVDELDMDGVANNHSLTLNAHNSIFLNASIYDSDTGTTDDRLTDLNLNADIDNDGAGNVEFDSGSVFGSYDIDVRGDINIGSNTEDVKFDATSSFYGGNVNADGDINIGTGTSTASRIDGDVLVIGSGAGFSESIQFNSNNLKIYANGNVDLTAGSNSGNSVSFLSTNSQGIYANEVTITGGNVLGTTAGFNVSGSSGSQFFNTTDDINLNAGSGAMAGDAEIVTSASGSSQTFQVRGHLNLNSTAVAVSKIKSQGTQDIQTGFGNPGSTSIVLNGTTVGMESLLESDGTQTIDTNGGVLTLSNGHIKVTTSGSSVADIGDIAFSEGIVDLNGGTLNIAGNVVGPMFTGTGTKKFMSTTINNNSATATSMTGGTLDLDSSTFNNNGTFNLTGGNIDINTSGTFNNNSTFNWSAGNIDVDGSGNFNNNAAGVFNDSASSTFTGATGAGGDFENVGTYNKTAGTTSFNALLNNNGGMVDVDSGTTLDFTSSPEVFTYTQSSGTTHADGSLTGTGKTFNFTGGTVSGAGTVAPGTVLNASNTTFAPGNSIGTLTVSSFNSTGGNTLEIEVQDAVGTHDRLSITGDGTLLASDTVNVSFVGGYTGPAIIGNTDVIASVITTGGTSFSINPTVNHDGDAGLTPTDTSAPLSPSLDLSYFRASAAPVAATEEVEEVIEMMEEETVVPTEEMMTGEPSTPPVVTEETPDVVNLIVTITEEERKALVEAGLLAGDEDDDDEKKNRPTQMCLRS